MEIKVGLYFREIKEINPLHVKILELKKNHLTSYWLISGSIQTFSALILRACLAAETKNEFQESYRFSKNVYDAFLEKAYHLMKNNCVDLHDMDVSFEA